MANDSTFCFKGNDDFYIENGIIKGYETPYLTPGYSSYGEFLFERLKSRAEFVAQVDGVTGKEETYATMLDKSIKCAIWLKKQNVKPGDVVGISTHNQMDMYVPCFASLFIGAIFNPWWDFELSHVEAKHFLNLTTPKVVFVDEKSAVLVSEVAKDQGSEAKIIVFGNVAGFQCLDDIFMSADETSVDEFQCTILSSVDEPALIAYTSGTTGLAKGALHTHRSLFGNLNIASSLGANKNVVTTIIFTTLSWISGVLSLLRGVVVGEKRIICYGLSEEKIFEIIDKYQANWMFMASSMATRLQKCPQVSNYDLSSVHFMHVSGAVMEANFQKVLAETFPRARVLQVYGSTELGGAVLRQSINSKPGSCGRLVKNVWMKVVDPETGRVLGPHENGEACFKSPFMLSRFYKNPEETKNIIDSEGWLHSGDLVHYDEEGNVFVVDRIRELIKCRGHHIAPATIEQVLQTHPGVNESVVFGVAHDMDDERPMAFVAKMPNADVTKEELQKLVADTLPDYMQLRGGVLFLDQLPHTSSGKINRARLRKLAKIHSI